MGEIKDSHSKKNYKIFISAGEESGELHGAELIKEIKKQSELNVNFTGLGGNRMEKEGANLLYRTNELSTIGFLDVIKKLNFFRGVLKKSLDCVREISPDCVILIDYPGFNLKLAQKLRNFYKGKIFYYISPQLWAWHEKRVFIIKKNIDTMLVVFPFEVDFYNKYGIDAIYVGHPLIKRIREFLENTENRKKVFGGEKIITLLPGSRRDEINHHLPVLLKAAKQLKKEFEVKINISKSKGVDEKVFKKFEDDMNDFNLTEENTLSLILNSDLVLTKAGTSTMECALIGTPFIIFYKTFPLNYYLLKPLVKVDKLGMVNILASENIIKELVQKDFTENNLLIESRRILTDIDYQNKLKNKLTSLWKILGNKEASVNAAGIILNSIS